jgi:hypothetical protein
MNYNSIRKRMFLRLSSLHFDNIFLRCNLSRQSSLNIEARNYSKIESGDLIADWLIFQLSICRRVK